MNKRIVKTGSLILTLVLLLNSIIIPFGAYADTTNDYEYVPPADNINSVKDIMAEEARANHSIIVLSECLAGGINTGESWDALSKPSEIFDRLGDDLTPAVGYWMEKILTGSADDAKVHCSEKVGSGHSIFTEVTQALGITKKELFCKVGEDGRVTGPGIFKAKDGKECGDESEDTEYTRNGNGGSNGHTELKGNITDYGWGQHLRDLYNAAKEKKGWDTSFETLETKTYPSVNGYFVYTKELETHCGGRESYDEKSEDATMELNDVTQDSSQAAKVVYTHFSANNEIEHSFVKRFEPSEQTVGRDMKVLIPKKCSDMIARANEDDLYGAFRRRMMTVLNRQCKKSIEDRLTGYEGEVPDETQSAYDSAVANTSMFPVGQFIEAVDGGDITDETTGWICMDIGDIEGAGQTDAEVDEEEEVDPDCYTNAGSLGWILCPIINQGGDFVTMIYEKMIEPFLILDSGLFNRDEVGGNATYKAWTQFQTYANIAFIAIFLAVIFSQLTGYGIDNYGIKKILPKLIMAALLINLSYIICQLAIDIANIIGIAIKDVLATIGQVDYNTMALAETGGSSTGKAVVATTIIVALVGIITTAAILSHGTAIIVPVFIAIIGIVIAVFSLFCILAIRKAFAVVLVVLSPMAFLCYILPNTKRIFDKWFTAMKGVLIAFPVCSAMVYGGQAVARILVQASGSSNMPFLIALSAAVMSIAPVFLIPGVLRKSMGAISAAVDRVSRGASHRARGRVANSNLAHDLQRNNQLRRSGYVMDKDGKLRQTRLGKIQDSLPRTNASRRRLDARRLDAIKSYGEMSQAGSTIGAAGQQRLENIHSANLAKQKNQRISDLEDSYKLGNQGINVADNSEGGALENALTAAILSGDEDRVKALSNIATAQGDKGRTAVKRAMRAADKNASEKINASTAEGKQQLAQFNAGKKALASNIMDNYAGAYKENARSTFDWAAENQYDGTGMTMSEAEQSIKSSSSLRGSHMNNMDDEDFNNLVARKNAYEEMAASGKTLTDKQMEDYKNIVDAATAGKDDQSFTATKVERQRKVEALSTVDGVAAWNNISNKDKKNIVKANPQNSGESREAYQARLYQAAADSIKSRLM